VLARGFDVRGRIQAAQGQLAEAESDFKRALALRENVLPADHPDIATVLEHQAALLRAAGKLRDAASSEERSKAIRSKRRSL
jgi:tetratricopeptide (TPR) repeat protein